MRLKKGGVLSVRIDKARERQRGNLVPVLPWS